MYPLLELVNHRLEELLSIRVIEERIKAEPAFARRGSHVDAAVELMLSAFRRSNKRVDVILILQVRPIGAVLDVDDMDIAVDTRSLCDDTRSFDDCLLDLAEQGPLQ